MVGATHAHRRARNFFFLIENVLRFPIAMIKTALSHEVLDQFSRNKVHINLHTVYFLVIAKAKVWRYLFGVITPVQKVGGGYH